MIDVSVVSAFSKDGRGGNRAGVVLDHPELTETQKKTLSAELGYAETAFVTSSNVADFNLEYFTPTEEVPLCGHATIAAFVLLKNLGRLSGNDFTIQTKSGVLSVSVSEDGLVMMEQNLPKFFQTVMPDLIAPVMGCSSEDIAGPIQIVSTGLRDILLPLRSRDALDNLKPDMVRLAALSDELDVVGVHAFTTYDCPNGVDAVCRNFAPLYGIDEESATGTSNCALGSYLYKYMCKKESYVFEQGYSLGLPSRVLVGLDCPEGEVRRASAGGRGLVEGAVRAGCAGALGHMPLDAYSCAHPV